MPYVYSDKNHTVRFASETPLRSNLDRREAGFSMGRERVAVLANYGDQCGIATYAKYLVDAMRPLVDDLKIFAEDTGQEREDGVEYCWRRGESMRAAVGRLKDWGPSAVLVQHEFGIFPKASHLLGMLQMLQDVPYVVTLHSVYEHLDKVVCTSPMRNVVVHSVAGRDCLRRFGFRGNVGVINHGCVSYGEFAENWNIYQTPYAIVQFGFGFGYKGVDKVLEAVAALRREQPEKYRDIFYTYLCSESRHARGINDAYYRSLLSRAADLGIEDNVAIIRGFQDESVICQYLRTNKLAVFPYETDPSNVVYGASGAVRIAMANGIPTVASSSHMFDDLDGVLPRPSDATALAAEIDRVFSCGEYRKGMVEKASSYVAANSWAAVADRYLEFMKYTAGTSCISVETCLL